MLSVEIPFIFYLVSILSPLVSFSSLFSPFPDGDVHVEGRGRSPEWVFRQGLSPSLDRLNLVRFLVS